jgi:DNA-binding HxlR family transcriptional regulator
VAVLKAGARVRGSKTGRPIMTLLDLLGRRWTLRILWELRHGPLGFNELQESCGSLSPSVLSQRLQELLETHILELDDAGRYRVRDDARNLGELLFGLDRWAKRWAKRLGSSELGSASARRGAGRDRASTRRAR